MSRRSILYAAGAALVVALVVYFAACREPSDVAQIEDVTEEFVEDVKAEDYESACEKFSKRAIRELEQAGVGLDADGCPEILEQVAEDPESGLTDETGDVDRHRGRRRPCYGRARSP